MSPIAIEINANFHIVSGKGGLDKDDPVFRGYRRKWEELPKKFYTGELPLYLDVEAASVCNLRCEVAFIDFKDYGAKRKDMVSDWACPYIWQRMIETWGGTISVCGFDYTDNHKLGNVKKDPIRVVWNGKEIERIRKLHREVAICNGCPLRTTEILKRKGIS